MEIPMRLVYQYMLIFFNFKITSNHLHSLQVENCDSNSRLVKDEDDYGKFRPERVKRHSVPNAISLNNLRDLNKTHIQFSLGLVTVMATGLPDAFSPKTLFLLDS